MTKTYLKAGDLVECIDPPKSPYGMKKGARVYVENTLENLVCTNYWAEPLWYKSDRFCLVERLEGQTPYKGKFQ